MTYPSGRTVTNTFDNAGRLQSFAGTLGDGTSRIYANEFQYTALNGFEQERFGTTTPIYHKQRYNTRGQLWDMRASTVPFTSDPANGDRGSVVNYYDNSFIQGGSGPDNNGNLLRQEIYIPGSGFFQDNFAYDSLNRLTSIAEKLNGTSTDTFRQAYSYDRYGNRTIDQVSTFGANIPKPDFTVNTTNNRLGVPGGQSGTMTYDSAGNLTTDTYSAAAVTRLYDAENRMTKESQANSYDAGIYSYDGDGRRVRRIVNGVETWQVYGIGGELLAEYPATNPNPTSPQKEYGYRNGQLLITATVTAGSGGSAFTFTEDPVVAASTTVKAVHLTELRTAVNQARAHAGLTAATWTDDPAQATVTAIKAVHITELRARLDEARAALGLPAASYTDPTLTAGSTNAKAIHIQELRTKTNESLTAVGAGSIDLRWLVSDHLGTPRMIFDQSGSLANVSRHDYLPFGEELFAGTGGRTTAQGYVGDNVRQKFTQKERDNETGLDYFSARYYSSVQGRFTSSDPGSFKIADPQNWDRYTYVQNNPLKFIDPTGKDLFLTGENADYIVAELQRASGLKLKRDAKTGQVTIDSSSKRIKKGTSFWLANKLGQITSDHDAKVRINTGRNQPGVAGDAFKNREIDVSDYDAFKKADKVFGIRLLAHVLAEYYDAEKMSGPDDAKFKESHEEGKGFEANVISDFTGWWEQPRQETLVKRTPTEIEVRFDYSTVSYDVLYKAGVGGDVTVAKVTKTEKQKPRRQ